MSSQEHHDNDMITSQSVGEPSGFVVGCNHNHHHNTTSNHHHLHLHNHLTHNAITSGQNQITEITTMTQSAEIATCEHNCNCGQHGNNHIHLQQQQLQHQVFQQHYHHHNNFHHNHEPPIIEDYHSDSNNQSNNSNNGPHYVPASSLSENSQNLNLPTVSCECGSSIQSQSGRSSRLISCDENNPSGSDDNSRKCLSRNK